MSQVLVINGPNLARLGSREPEIYGTLDYAALEELITKVGSELGLSVTVRQSDSEVDLIHWIHDAIDSKMAIIINAAAFTHYSYALRDALAQVSTPKIEVHISNPASREIFRQHSVISAVVDGVIAGFGFGSYELALRSLASKLLK